VLDRRKSRPILGEQAVVKQLTLHWRIFRAIVNADEADLPGLIASQASVRNPNAGVNGALREQLSDVRANRSD